MIKIKPLGAIVILTIALFFLLYGQCTVCNIQQYNGLDSNSREYYIQSQPNILGDVENFSNNPINCVSGFVPSQESSFRLVDYAIIYANITTEGVYMLAYENNSRLNAKTHVFVYAVQDIIINGLRLNSSDSTFYTSPFPKSLVITAINQTRFIINLQKVSSLDDIEDSDRPVNITQSISLAELIKYSIVGIPATFASLITCIVVIILLKETQVQEGLYDEL